MNNRLFQQIYSLEDFKNARSAERAETDICDSLPYPGANKYWYFPEIHGRRIGRIKIQSELIMRCPPGDIVELGSGPGHNVAVFSWCLQELNRKNVAIYGFDTFEGYLEEHIKDEGNRLAEALRENQDSDRWLHSRDDLQEELNSLVDFVDVELIKGDICETTKNFMPRSKMISMVNIDTNVYKPGIEGLFNLEKYFVNNTILIVDSGFLHPDDPLQGEHRALYEYATKRNYPIFKSNWGDYCSFIAVVQK